MRRSAFADLIGVSKQMVSKYEAAGDIVVDGVEVDAAASLAKLAGRLDEDKRQRALAFIGGEQRSPIAAAAPPTLSPEPAPSAPTARQERDAVERDLKRLRYGQEAGELVSAAEVADAAAAAVAEMREAFANGSRDLANEICAAFAVPSDKAPALKRHLASGFERALGRFSIAIGGQTPPEPARLSATG